MLQMPPGDVLLHCGDFCRDGGSLEQIQKFNEFLQMQPYAVKIVISGNHDFCFDPDSLEELKAYYELSRDYSAIDPRSALSAAYYLEDEGMAVAGYNFWGSPWVPQYSASAFSIPESSRRLIDKRSMIPTETDVLMTHGPPYGILDYTLKGANAGCRVLREHLARVRPLVHCFGHIHERYGSRRTNDTLYINAASIAPNYRRVKEPMVFDLPAKSQ
jgi:predicted phosphodiesterase